MPKPIVRMESVTKRYRTAGQIVVPVDNVSLEIPSQCCTLLQGPSGCGKTTLLNLIGCLVRPTSGRIWLLDKETTNLADQFLTLIRREQVGFIFQQYNLLYGVTSLQNVCLPLIPMNVPKTEREDRAVRMLEMLGVRDRAQFLVNDLSGGEQQRVAIARALINDPDLILADEPNSNVDEKTSQRILDLFQELQRRGKTIIVSSHDRYLVERLNPDTVIPMSDDQREDENPERRPDSCPEIQYDCV